MASICGMQTMAKACTREYHLNELLKVAQRKADEAQAEADKKAAQDDETRRASEVREA